MTRPSPRHMRVFWSQSTSVRSVAGAAAVGSLAILGIVRVLRDGCGLENDAQWRHVRQHEQRFITALRIGTAAEGDESGN